jgi:hypothetical protein
MPIVVEAVEQTDYLIWSILKGGLPDEIEISRESVNNFYYAENSENIDTECGHCEDALAKIF